MNSLILELLCEIFISPNEKEAYYHFYINSNGVVLDQVRKNPAKSWNSEIEVKVVKSKDSWLVEGSSTF